MSQKRTKSKKNKRKNLLINILAGFLILLSLALIFNSKIRNIFMVWNTNKYQVSQVSKEKLEENNDADEKEAKAKKMKMIEMNLGNNL